MRKGEQESKTALQPVLAFCERWPLLEATPQLMKAPLQPITLLSKPPASLTGDTGTDPCLHPVSLALPSGEQMWDLSQEGAWGLL